MSSPLLDNTRLKSLVITWRADCGERLRQRRKRLGMSCSQLADLTGMTERTIRRCELGLTAARDANRIAIAHALGCEVEEIWPPLERRYVAAVAEGGR